ncbi:FliA/WhiG family RNA polymerase sigma factor [Spirochaetes bacterium]|uniref:FliA/WhiG family RNA polymerase sigma factor n=1 Tax=Candidatus Scatousia excrementipullorum TaxID=2840936 RepID=A0A9D9DLU7_9BACT|nr:FliA/WhiG family RNA polymerase sigma factor [Candidatus Scatousia excrementipullorum]
MDQSFDFTSYNNIKRLSEEELTTVWQEYFKDKSNKQVRDTLIVQYIYLIRYVVGRIKVSLPPTVSIEDVAGYGVEGLINAIERFSIQKNTRFETYALIRIRGAILDKIRAEDFLPRSVRKKIKDIKNAQEHLKQELGRMPTTAEIAKYLDMDPEKVTQIMSEDTIMTSIYDKKGNSDDSVEIIDTIQDTVKLNPQESMEEKNVKQELEKALRRLPERERIIMVLYYQENMTLKEIGATINMSESRVCQLHAQAIMKLKNILSENRTSRMHQSIIA